MNFMNSAKFSILLGAVAAFSVATNISYADDASTVLAKAKELFNQRKDLAKNQEAIDLLASVEGKGDEDMNFDILILESRALYWKGQHASLRNDKMDIHALGQAKAEAARKINEDYAESYYYAGINLARWAKAKGIPASLGRKKELMGLMDSAIQRPARDGQAGEAIDGYGPDRVFGRMYFELPGVAGGSHDKSVKYLSTAYEKAQTTALNVVYFAQTLWDGNSAEKAQAKKILDDLLSKNPETLNPARVPEATEEFVEARKLRDGMGN